LILGHSPEPVIEAIKKQIENGTHFGTRHPLEVELAEEIVKFEGGWHGGYDALDITVKPPFEIPESASITEEATKHTISAPYNDLEGTFQKVKNEEVAVVIESLQIKNSSKD